MMYNKTKSRAFDHKASRLTCKYILSRTMNRPLRRLELIFFHFYDNLEFISRKQ